MTAAETPRVEGEIIGFRQWRVSQDLELTGAMKTVVWAPGDNVARCESLEQVAIAIYDPSRRTARAHVAPESGCHCGFYALHVPDFWYGDDGSRHGSTVSAMAPLDPGTLVAGLVAASGRVEVHHKGFRAERARVVAIAVPGRRRDAAVARAVAAEYGVPAVPQDELERVASEFGDTVPEGLRPPARHSDFRTQAKLMSQLMASMTAGVSDLAAASREIKATWKLQKTDVGAGGVHQGATHGFMTVEEARTVFGLPAVLDAQRKKGLVTIGYDAAGPATGFLTRAEMDELPKPTFDRIRDLNRPVYDPNQFVAKRKGGRR